MTKLVSCPVCGKKLLPNQAITNHIITTAKSEAYREMKNLFTYHKKNFHNVSRAVLLRQMPHFGFIKRNTKDQKVFDWRKTEIRISTPFFGSGFKKEDK